MRRQTLLSAALYQGPQVLNLTWKNYYREVKRPCAQTVLEPSDDIFNR
ncbi:MAG: hypothetical protein OJF50_001005 [Nitrospira sp.]|nr:hypothetical protein [Nitrospira sp.]